MHTAAAEAGSLASGVQPREGRAVCAHDVAGEVSLDTAEGLAGEQVHADGDEGAVFGVEEAVRRGDAAAAIWPVGATVVDEHGLGVFGVGVVHLRIALVDHVLDLGVVELGSVALLGQLVHAGDKVLEVVAHDEVAAVLLEVLHRDSALLAEDALQQQPHALAGDVRVLLGAGQGELAGDDGLVEDEPGVVVARVTDVAKAG